MSSFSSIAHANLEICSPVPWRVYREMLLGGGFSDQPEIVDIGCGRGALLANTIEILNGSGIGIDIENSLAQEPTLSAQELVAAGKLKFIFQDARLFFEHTDRSFDLILCVGSSHALGGPDETYAVARKHLKPKGKLLFGEIVWKSKPSQEFLNFLECTEGDQLYPSQLVESLNRSGLSVQRSVSCTQQDFETYELNLRNTMIEWCKNHPNDLRASDFIKRSDAWWEAREKWARQAFGFEIILATHD